MRRSRNQSELAAAYDHVIQLRSIVAAQEAARSEIKAKPAYSRLADRIRECNAAINDAVEKQSRLLAGAADSRDELEKATNSLFVLMRDQDQREFRDAKLVFINKSAVDKQRLINSLDIDDYVELSSVTQTALKAYAAKTSQPFLLRCVVTDISPIGVSFSDEP